MNVSSPVDFGHSPFEFTPHSDYYLIRFAGDLDLDLAREFEKRLQKKLPEIKTAILIDFSLCKGMHPQWFRVLMNLVSHARSIHKKLRCFGMPDKLRFYLAENGMDSTLQNFSTLETAKADL
jgi:anti-anti-sigma regulatory factor